MKKNYSGTFKITFRKWYKAATNFIQRKPLGSFFIALGLLFLVILIGHILTQPKPVIAQKPQAVQVTLYSIGTAPKATFQAAIEKAGVITINAQAPGIVQSISVKEGATVSKGDQLLSLSSNYQGGSALGVSAQIAQAQNQNVMDSYSEQQDAITKQQNIANDTYNSYTEQQSIASQSANNTNALISANQTVLNTLNQQLTTDQNNNVPSPTTMPQESEINTLQGEQNSLQASLATLQEQTNSGNPPGQIAITQRDLTLEQLDIQQKSLALNKQVTALQAQLAEVNADTMLPVSPVDGVVDRVFVRAGQQVSQGTELAVISAKEGSAQTIAVVNVPQEIAQNISRLEPSDIYINGNAFQVKPFYISNDATNGLLYSVFYTIPTALTNLVTDGQYIPVNIPINSANSGNTVPFVPIDAVYQTSDSNYLLVAVNGIAVTRKISLGNVFGSFVEVTSGLQTGDQVILDRNVIAGDKVTTKQS